MHIPPCRSVRLDQSPPIPFRPPRPSRPSRPVHPPWPSRPDRPSRPSRPSVPYFVCLCRTSNLRMRRIVPCRVSCRDLGNRKGALSYATALGSRCVCLECSNPCRSHARCTHVGARTSRTSWLSCLLQFFLAIGQLFSLHSLRARLLRSEPHDDACMLSLRLFLTEGTSIFQHGEQTIRFCLECSNPGRMHACWRAHITHAHVGDEDQGRF